MHSGFILVNKPVGPTSFALVHFLRKITDVKKIGHAGTLDPLASGLMICAIGRESTRKISDIIKKDKEYIVDICFGMSSAGIDLEGPVYITEQIPYPGRKKILSVLSRYIGVIDQVPPQRSAKKVNGKKAYELDRSGKIFTLSAQTVTIRAIKLKKIDWPSISIKVSCSSGTYMRSLVRDIAQDLGASAVMTGLVRTRIGDYGLNKAVGMDRLRKDNWHTFLFLPKK